MSDTCRLFPPFGDPWTSCLLPSQNHGSKSFSWHGAVSPHGMQTPEQPISLTPKENQKPPTRGKNVRKKTCLEKTDAGRDWGEEKGMTEDEMAGWHHRLDGRESE